MSLCVMQARCMSQQAEQARCMAQQAEQGHLTECLRLMSESCVSLEEGCRRRPPDPVSVERTVPEDCTGSSSGLQPPACVQLFQLSGQIQGIQCATGVQTSVSQAAGPEASSAAQQGAGAAMLCGSSGCSWAAVLIMHTLHRHGLDLQVCLGGCPPSLRDSLLQLWVHQSCCAHDA